MFGTETAAVRIEKERGGLVVELAAADMIAELAAADIGELVAAGVAVAAAATETAVE